MAMPSLLKYLLVIAIFIKSSNSLPLEYQEGQYGEEVVSLQNPENGEGARNARNTDWAMVPNSEMENSEKSANPAETSRAEGEDNSGKDLENGAVDNKNTKNDDQQQAVSEVSPSAFNSDYDGPTALKDDNGEEVHPEKSTTQSPKHFKVVDDERPTVAEYASSRNRKCPPHVRCAEAPKQLTCTRIQSVVRAPTVHGFSHNDCCPVHLCYREDGSRFYHFGLEVEDNSQRESQQQPAGSQSYNYRSYSSASSSQQNPLSFFPSSADAPSQSNIFKGPIRNRYQSAPGKTGDANNYNGMSQASPASRPGSRYNLQEFGEAASAVEQRHQRYPQGSSASSSASFAQVGYPEHEAGIPMDLPVQAPVESGAGPYSAVAEGQSPFGRVYGGYYESMPDNWSRYQRNIFPGQALGMNSPFNPVGPFPFQG